MSFFRSQMRYLVILFPGRPFRGLRNILWRSVGYSICKSANIKASAVFLCGDISVGDDTFIGDDVLIMGGKVVIGSNCDIAPRVLIHSGSHNIGDSARRAGLTFGGAITIGDGTWICAGAVITEGAHIGSGTVIAAGSVVIRGNYQDNVMLAGVPAKVVRKF